MPIESVYKARLNMTSVNADSSPPSVSNSFLRSTRAWPITTRRFNLGWRGYIRVRATLDRVARSSNCDFQSKLAGACRTSRRRQIGKLQACLVHAQQGEKYSRHARDQPSPFRTLDEGLHAQTGEEAKDFATTGIRGVESLQWRLEIHTGTRELDPL